MVELDNCLDQTVILVKVKVPDINKAIKALDGAAKGTRKDMKVKLRRPKARTKR